MEEGSTSDLLWAGRPRIKEKGTNQQMFLSGKGRLKTDTNEPWGSFYRKGEGNDKVPAPLVEGSQGGELGGVSAEGGTRKLVSKGGGEDNL